MSETNEKTSGGGNTALREAAVAKNDEFYTRRESIEAELHHYRKHFVGKVVYCNCDDPRVSQFWKYFYAKFSEWGLKRLIATGYKSDNSELFSEHKVDTSWCKEYDGVKETTRPLKSDGDFRKPECVEILRRADIVCTNPPFSLFRKYIEQLVDENKKFLVIGNMNAVSYKEIFRLIGGGKLWLGVTSFNTGMYFGVPKDFEYAPTYKFDREIKGQKVNRVPGVCWFTNLSHKKRNEELILTGSYKKDKSAYPKYDNYDAIEVGKVANIPEDYFGVMGVPITFLDKYNPNQFEILGIMNTGEENKGIRYEGTPHGRPIVNGKEIYLRILIKNKGV